MVRRKRDVAIIVLRCVIFGCCASVQQAAFGTGMVIPSKLAADGYVWVAQADTPDEPQAIVQETKNAGAPAEPQAVMQEIKSAARLSGSKQRRRKPKMAGVPAGSQAVVKETKEPESQAVVKETKEPEPQAVVKETKEPEPQAVVKETKESEPQAVVKETKESGSQAVVREAEETDTLDKPLTMAQKTKNADAPAKPQAEAKGLKVENTGKKKYGMAPVRWGVSVSETAGWERHSSTYHPANGSSISSRSDGFVNTQTAAIQAKTYILQPYIAQLGGNIGVVSSKNKGGGSGSSGASESRNNQLFGDGLLSLFSRSRFPFNMSISVKDDRTSMELQTRDVVTKRLDLDQTYRPMGSRSMYTGGYMRDTRISNINNWSAFGVNPNDTVTRSFWRGGYSTHTPEHDIDVTARYNEKVTGLVQNTSTRTDNFTVWDKYLPTDSLLSLSTFANLNLLNDVDLLNNVNSRARFLQANTKANWQPESEDIPLFLDGNFHLFSMLSTVRGGNANSSQSLGGNISARYLFSSNLTGYANGGVTSTNVNGKRNLITIQMGRANYSSNVVNLWKNSSYSWNANGGASNQTGNSSNSSVFGGVGQGLGVPYTFGMFGKKFRMNSRINQSLNTNISRVDGRSVTLLNGGSVSLGGLLASARPGKELLGGYGTAGGEVNTTATLSVNDSRTTGGKYPSHTRTYALILNLLETSKSAYSRYGIEAEATLGASQGTEGTQLFGSARAKYSKSRVFNVRGLDYVGSLQISTRSNSRVVDVNAQNPRFPWELDQRLRYKIGQNEVLLRGLVSDEYGVKNASLWLLFRVWRTIGN